MKSDQVEQKTKQKLKTIYDSLDMIELRQGINKIMQRLYEIQMTRSRKKIMS